MDGVNIFGELISSNNNITKQKEPPGNGLKYLDRSGNFDIGNKSLANVKNILRKVW